MLKGIVSPRIRRLRYSDVRRWLPLIDGIETYARTEGCKRVRIYGRKGWLHVLDGYEEKYIIMDKELG